MVPSSIFKTVTLNLNDLVIWAFTIYDLYFLGLNQIIALSASTSRFGFNTPAALFPPGVLSAGSVVGLKGNAGQSVYSASKAGLEGFTRSLAKEVASRNIRVNLLAPGAAPPLHQTPALHLLRLCFSFSLEPLSRPRPPLLPGFVRTDMTAALKDEDVLRSVPLGRFGEPDEVARAVLFLLESPYVTGQVLVVDGGLQLAM